MFAVPIINIPFLKHKYEARASISTTTTTPTTTTPTATVSAAASATVVGSINLQVVHEICNFLAHPVHERNGAEHRDQHQSVRETTEGFIAFHGKIAHYIITV